MYSSSHGIIFWVTRAFVAYLKVGWAQHSTSFISTSTEASLHSHRYRLMKNTETLFSSIPVLINYISMTWIIFCGDEKCHIKLLFVPNEFPLYYCCVLRITKKVNILRTHGKFPSMFPYGEMGQTTQRMLWMEWLCPWKRLQINVTWIHLLRYVLPRSSNAIMF